MAPASLHSYLQPPLPQCLHMEAAVAEEAAMVAEVTAAALVTVAFMVVDIIHSQAVTTA